MEETQSLRDAIPGEGRSAPQRPLCGWAEQAFAPVVPTASGGIASPHSREAACDAGSDSANLALRSNRGFLRRRAPFRAAFFAALAFTLFFSLYPHDTVQETFSEEVQAFDWLFHTLCYAALSATWLLGRTKRPRGLLPRLDAALAFTSLGCALEIAHALLPFVARTCTLSDASANALGAFLGAFLVPLPDNDPPSTGG